MQCCYLDREELHQHFGMALLTFPCPLPLSPWQALHSLAKDLHSRVSSPHPALEEEAKQVLAQLSLLSEFASRAVNEDAANLTLAARDFSLSLAQTYAGAALCVYVHVRRYGAGGLSRTCGSMLQPCVVCLCPPLNCRCHFTTHELASDWLLMDAHASQCFIVRAPC